MNKLVIDVINEKIFLMIITKDDNKKFINDIKLVGITSVINLNNNISFKTSCSIKVYNICEEGVGSNKRKSQQEAASKALNKISEIFKKDE